MILYALYAAADDIVAMPMVADMLDQPRAGAGALAGVDI